MAVLVNLLVGFYLVGCSFPNSSGLSRRPQRPLGYVLVRPDCLDAVARALSAAEPAGATTPRRPTPTQRLLQDRQRSPPCRRCHHWLVVPTASRPPVRATPIWLPPRNSAQAGASRHALPHGRPTASRDNTCAAGATHLGFRALCGRATDWIQPRATPSSDIDSWPGGADSESRIPRIPRL